MDVIEAAVQFVHELFRNNSGGHDAAHTMRVYRNAMRLADQVPECRRDIAALAALLHDADDHKLFSTENNANARKFLNEHGIAPEDIEAVCRAVNSVSFSQNRGKRPDTIEGMIVQDADRLDAIGAIGIARTFAYGGEHGRPIEDSISHFHEKLLLLRDEMNTDAARELAGRRHRFMLEFLDEYDAEVAHDGTC